MAQLSPILKQATPVIADSGKGVYITDEDGRRHLDFTAGIGVTSTGHCHPRVVEAAQEQVARLIHGQYTTIMHRPLLTLADRLGEVLPPTLDSVFFTSAGSEAVEAAVRLARQATRRPNVVVFHGGFHGRTIGAASLTSSATKFRSGFAPLMAGAVISPFPAAYRYGCSEAEATRFALQELDFLLATVSAPDDTAAFLIEPVLGEGGFIPATPGFLEGLQERADKHGILFIVDEIQAGFGRTGRFWSHQHFDVHPDIIITAKGLASGFPLSAIAASTALMSQARSGSHGGTYGGNAVACAAALATLDVIQEEGLVENAATQGDRLRQGLIRAASEHDGIGDVRGLGLMLGNEFSKPDGSPDPQTAMNVRHEAQRLGLLLLACGPFGNVIRMIPPLIVGSDDIDEALTIWDQALQAATA